MAPMQFFNRYGEGEFWVPAQEGPEGELAFDTGQWRAETVMDAVSEGEVTGPVPVEVEQLGIAVSVRVPVGGRQADDDLRAGRNRDATEIQRRHGVSKCRMRDRCVEAQEFFHGLWYLGGIGASWSIWPGLRNRATRLLPMRLAVVS